MQTSIQQSVHNAIFRKHCSLRRQQLIRLALIAQRFLTDYPPTRLIIILKFIYKIKKIFMNIKNFFNFYNSI